MDNSNYTQNREISWLRFNRRVLKEAKDKTVPLLERMKFIAIFTSNLDEFFMVRVGSLLEQIAKSDRERYDMNLDEIVSGEGINESFEVDFEYQRLLGNIYKAVKPMYKERNKIYRNIKRELGPYGVIGLGMKGLTEEEKEYVSDYFKKKILPVLSPQIIGVSHPFPFLLNKEIYVVANLKKKGVAKMGIVQIPNYVSEIVYLPGDAVRYIRIEKIIIQHLEMVFWQYEVTDKNYICVTRNADIAPKNEDFVDNDDFRVIMEKTLYKRRKTAPVRLEVFSPLSIEMEEYFCQKLSISPDSIFRTKMPMKLDYIFQMIDKMPLSVKEPLSYSSYTHRPHLFEQAGSIMKMAEEKDILLHYPYESMELFFKLIKEASNNPRVLSIKMTIYRLAKQSRLIDYLCEAAENKKEVTVLIELRARFDEEHNIEWSKRLEEAGCRVIYGMESYKVHSKMCLITYENDDETQYITNVSTGNYNEKTAKLYTDYSLITASNEIGKDANNFFRNMALGNHEGVYHHLLVSPFNLRNSILELIDQEIEKGGQGRVTMKMNSVTDLIFINKVKDASRAGVKINLIVRGICCILPGIEGQTENLVVTSIVGRFLEHSRVYIFGEGANKKIYIGSADMMTRNTERRVEVACPIYDPEIKERLYKEINLMLSDNVKARIMDNTGIYRKREIKEEPINSQEILMESPR